MGAPAIFNGDYVKLLKKALRLGYTSPAPSNAEAGDLYVSQDNSYLHSYSSGSGWKPVSRVIGTTSTTLTTTFTTSSTSYTDVTGLSVNLVPLSTSHKVSISGHLTCVNSSGSDFVMVQLIRSYGGDTPICQGTAASSRPQVSVSQFSEATGYNLNTIAFQFIDSPSASTLITYKIQVKVKQGTACINRTGADPDGIDGLRGTSTITVQEVVS